MPGSPGMAPQDKVLLLSASLYEVVPPRTSLLLFLLGWRTFPQSWRSGFGQACPTIGGHPKGLGLEGIRGASYALTVPAKQKRVLRLSGTGNKLQVEVFAHYSFDSFGDLTVQPSFEPRYGSAVCYEDHGFGLCYLY